MKTLIKLLGIPALILAGAATAQVTGGGVTGGGNGGVSGTPMGGLASDFAGGNTPAGNTSNKGGLGPALESVFGDQQAADAECAQPGDDCK